MMLRPFLLFGGGVEVGKPKGKLNIILELNAAAALERMGWLRVNEAWSKEITVGGEPHTSYIPGPATKANSERRFNVTQHRASLRP